MNRTELALKLSKEYRFQLSDAKAILDYILNTIGDELATGQEIHIGGFGNFKPVNVPVKSYHMPDGRIVKGKARVAIRFAPTAKLVDKVNHR